MYPPKQVKGFSHLKFNLKLRKARDAVVLDVKVRRTAAVHRLEAGAKASVPEVEDLEAERLVKTEPVLAVDTQAFVSCMPPPTALVRHSPMRIVELPNQPSQSPHPASFSFAGEGDELGAIPCLVRLRESFSQVALEREDFREEAREDEARVGGKVVD